MVDCLCLFPVEFPVCRSVFLSIWHCNLSAELTKSHSLQTVFLAILLHWVSNLILRACVGYIQLSREVCSIPSR